MAEDLQEQGNTDLATPSHAPSSRETTSSANLGEGASSPPGSPEKKTACALASPPSTTPCRLAPPPWWRPAPAPLIALIFSCYGVDCLLSGLPLGIGSALGVWLLAIAVLAVRRDLPVSAVLLISLGSVLNAAALVIQGTWWSVLLGLLIVPAALYLPRWQVAVPDEKREPSLYWWNYWFQCPKGAICRGVRVLAWTLSVLVGLVLFCVFLNIFAVGNPVVAQVRLWLEYATGRWLWMAIDWTIFPSLFKWFVGFVCFGFLLLPLRKRVQSGERGELAKPFLPALPFVMLLFINLAFLIANGADLAFLWRGVLPEGISQTSYLYQGAESLIWAAVLAAIFLVGIFRSRGSVRGSFAGKIAGYVLVLQTGLLAASVALRLCRQIEAHGFSPFRVEGFLCLGSGVILLALLVGYMVGRGEFRRYLGQAAVVGYFVLTLVGICTPVQISGMLNLALMGDNPQWRFTAKDMWVFDVDKGENIPLAIAVYERELKTNRVEAAMIRSRFLDVAQKWAQCMGGEPASWRNVNLRQNWMRYHAEWICNLPLVTPETPTQVRTVIPGTAIGGSMSKEEAFSGSFRGAAHGAGIESPALEACAAE